MSFVSMLSFVALQAIFVCTTLLVALRKTIHGVLIFCTDLIIMTLYAILTSFALVAVFLGLTVWSCLLVGQQKEIASPRPGFPSNLFKVQSRSISAPVPPQTLSTRWINHTWNVLHATRFGGISPVVFFLSFFVPALLTCALIHQQNQYEKARGSEIHKRLLVDETLLEVQKIRDEQVQSVEAIRTSFKCNLCTSLYWQPYTLAPCGHTFNVDCLQRAFRAAHPTPRYLRLWRVDLTIWQKRCPMCHAVVVQPPALAWVVKTVADAVAENRDDAPLKPDPWKGIFKPSPVAADDEDI